VLHSENLTEADAAQEIVKIAKEEKDSKREVNKTFYGSKASKDKQAQEAILNQAIERR